VHPEEQCAELSCSRIWLKKTSSFEKEKKKLPEQQFLLFSDITHV